MRYLLPKDEIALKINPNNIFTTGRIIAKL